MAMKCGNCHTNKIAKRIQPPSETDPRAAVQPINGGNAPGMAPTAVASVVRFFSGVLDSNRLLVPACFECSHQSIAMRLARLHPLFALENFIIIIFFFFFFYFFAVCRLSCCVSFY